MAEWDSPAQPHDYPPKIQSPPHLPPLPDRSKTRSPAPPSPPPPNPSENDPSLHPGTYVVQAPKELIFRVPPSQNARLAEEYRRKMQNRQRKCPYSLRFLGCSLSILLAVIFILGLAGGIFYLVVRPGIPSFTVETLAARKLPNKAREQFNLIIRSVNPSFKMGYCYEAGGNAALSHKGREIAAGKTPGYCQGFMSSSSFKLTVEGGNSSGANLADEAASLSLLIQYPVRLKVGGVRVLSMSLDIACDFRVSGLGTTTNRTHNVSRGCSAKMPLI
ncbi:hypothetical protein KSP39_PZI010289 [Platanthera zijinensis]|uniref:Late embryogenesis abundant protein LEA-2 subgroup domain-containing protein n=1 Tax=Platanthera zijinensis TaxID=2320716 RepID=A0AAP0BJH0_9ASPA